MSFAVTEKVPVQVRAQNLSKRLTSVFTGGEVARPAADGLDHHLTGRP